jgi:hypothetical protein
MASAAAMIGAVTMSRALTDQKLSDSLLQAVEESIARTVPLETDLENKSRYTKVL